MATQPCCRAVGTHLCVFTVCSQNKYSDSVTSAMLRECPACSPTCTLRNCGRGRDWKPCGSPRNALLGPTEVRIQSVIAARGDVEHASQASSATHAPCISPAAPLTILTKLEGTSQTVSFCI